MSMLQQWQWQSVGSCSNTKHNTNGHDGDGDGDEESSTVHILLLACVMCPVCLHCGKCKKSMRPVVHSSLPIRTGQINAPSARKDTPRCLARAVQARRAVYLRNGCVASRDCC